MQQGYSYYITRRNEFLGMTLEEFESALKNRVPIDGPFKLELLDVNRTELRRVDHRMEIDELYSSLHAMLTSVDFSSFDFFVSITVGGKNFRR